MSYQRSYFFIHKKSLGQNFLIDQRIRNKIIDACELKPTDIILEIGPGKGFLTEAIAPHVKNIIAIEKDNYLASQLKERFKNSNVNVIHDDILTFDFSLLPFNFKIIGNLPYNIATAIIEKSFKYKDHFSTFYMMIQLEYTRRLVAQPHSKDYGSFTCFVQFHAYAKKLFSVKNTAFRPIPNVQSCFVKLEIHKHPLYKIDNEDWLFYVIRQAFRQRRKTIQNTLSNLAKKESLILLLQSLNISPHLRAENLTLTDFIKIAQKLDSS